MLTGDAIHYFDLNILDGERLSAWAERLLLDGRDTPQICMAAAAEPDMHWQDVRRLFIAICRELGISEDIEKEVVEVKKRVMLDEYRAGQRKGAELLFHFGQKLREQIGFPEEGVACRIVPDEPEGTNASGFYSFPSNFTGEDLEARIRRCFLQAGLLEE